MKIQLNNINDFPIKGAAFSQGKTKLALSFFDGSFAVLHASKSCDYPRIEVDWSNALPETYLVKAGAFTQQERDDHFKQIEKTRNSRKEQHDRAMLARLKAKYE